MWISVDIEGEISRFKRMYIYFGALKKAGKRVVGLLLASMGVTRRLCEISVRWISLINGSRPKH